MIAHIPPQLWCLITMAASLALAVRNFPKALLCLFPSLLRTHETDDDGSLDALPTLARVRAELAAAGFRPLGAIEIQPPLGAGRAELLFGAPELHAFADVDGHGGSLRVTLYTPYQSGNGVITSNFQRPGREGPTLLVGGLPKHDVKALLAVHRRRTATLEESPSRPVPWPDISLAGRVAADAAFARGAGRQELQRSGFIPLMIVLMSFGCAAIAVLQLTRLR